ncbi:MAG: glycosyltransferase family 2 protein [Candidatus Komeilibacteria bacterium]|nr:glycosyltransferase family 2 protein [Candidatus Komeilibacteria bacterium]
MIPISSTAIIIVTFNGRLYLEKLLPSLITSGIEQRQIYVIDNNSKDDTVTFIKASYPDIQLSQPQRNTGFAEGNNIGLRKAIDDGYEFLMLLNQDTVVTDNWLPPLLSTMAEEQTVAAVQPLLLLYKDQKRVNTSGNVIHYLGFGYGRDSGRPLAELNLTASPINYASGAAVLLRAAVFKKLDMFGEEMFMYLEDLDLGWRLWLAGYECRLQPASIVYHQYEFNRSIRQVYYFERNRWLCLLQNYKPSTILLLAPALLLMELGQLVYALKNKWFLKKIISYFYFADPVNWALIQKRRRQVRKIRRRSDSEMVEMFSGHILFQEINSPLLLYIANPFFNIYQKLVLIFISRDV